MARKVVTLSVRNERITFDAGDRPAIQRTVDDALKAEGSWHRSRGEESVPAAISFSVADKSRLTGRRTP